MSSLHLEGSFQTMGSRTPHPDGSPVQTPFLEQGRWAAKTQYLACWRGKGLRPPSHTSAFLESPGQPSPPTRRALQRVCPNLLDRCPSLVSSNPHTPPPSSSAHLQTCLRLLCSDHFAFLAGWPLLALPPCVLGAQLCQKEGGGGALPWHHAPALLSCPNLPSSLLRPPESPQCCGCVALCPPPPPPTPFPASLRREPNCDPSWLERQGGGQSLGEWRSLGSVLCWHLTDSCFSRAKEPPATPNPAS